MTRIARALARATERLYHTSDTPRLDAELLMSAALGIARDKLILDPPNVVIPATFSDMVDRRLALEPVAYITGRRAFWNIDLHVGPGVLVPRPDSEVLIASALEHFDGSGGPQRILDLGTGPGTLLLAALDVWPAATGLGIDVSRRALSYASANARRLGFEKRLKFKIGNWAEAIDESFDLILCNPPYVPEGAELGPGVAEFEPAEALFAGPEGLDDIRRLAPEIPRLLAEGGLAAVEIGSGQAAAAIALLEEQGLAAKVANDLGGRPRAVLLTRI